MVVEEAPLHTPVIVHLFDEVSLTVSWCVVLLASLTTRQLSMLSRRMCHCLEELARRYRYAQFSQVNVEDALPELDRIALPTILV